jgi:hypothetical protein
MGCPNEILFGFSMLGKPDIVIGPYAITPTGTYNGQSFYTWFDVDAGVDFILRWDITNNRWELGVPNLPYSDFELQAYLAYDLFIECPLDPTQPFKWEVVSGELFDYNTSFGDPIPVEGLTPEQECYPILVWNTQCEFAQATLKYVQQMQFGIFCCETLDKLKNKYRALEILNCYDVRDIPNNTTDYNALTYQQIKNLLNS